VGILFGTDSTYTSACLPALPIARKSERRHCLQASSGTWGLACYRTIVFFALVCGLGSAPAAEFQLRRQSEPQGPLLTLGDLAEVVAADHREADALAAIELFPSPPPGGQRCIRLREIQDLLLLRGVNLAEHRFSGSSQVVVTTANLQGPPRQSTVPAATVEKYNRQVREAVLRYIKGHASTTEPWNVELDLAPGQAQLLSGADREIFVRGGSPPWAGSQRFQIAANSPDGPVQFELLARVRAVPAVVVAARSLARGSVVRFADVQLRRDASVDEQAETFHQIDDVVGLETVRAIPAGKIIQRASIRPPLLVRRGEVVTVYARSPGINVRTNARARDDGSLGELVAVESLEDREPYFARVSGIREVEVYARAMRARPRETALGVFAPGGRPANGNKRSLQ